MKEIEKILNIFRKIALPTGGKKIGNKELKIIEILKNKYPNIYYKNSEGIIIPAKSEAEKMVISSHYDLIPTFKKGFKNKKDPFIERENGFIIGALDNTITNAILIYLLLNMDIPDNVEIIFTNMEEIGCIGMQNYIKRIKKEEETKELFFVNLDVTNDNWENKVSLEMDNPIYEIIHFLKDKIKGMTEEREGDDLCEVINANLKGFSFCLPTKKTIHSWKNRTTREHIKTYLDNLKFLIQNSSKLIEKSKNEPLYYSTIDDILKYTKEEIKEKIKKRQQIAYYGYYEHDYYNEPYFDFSLEENEEILEGYEIDIIDTICEITETENIRETEIIETIQINLMDAIYNYLFIDSEPFTIEDLLIDLEKDKKALRLAKKVLNNLTKKQTLKTEIVNKEKIYYPNLKD